MDKLGQFLAQVKNALDIPILEISGFRITVWTLLTLILLVVVLVLLAGRVRRWVARGLLARLHVQVGVREAIGVITQYLFLVVGFLIILQSMGIDITTLNILAGTVGIGVGFGLQGIVTNFISGLIILLERPIKVGDRIEVSEANGRVVKIGARSTTVITNDNIAIIIPNSKLISENVVNWSHNDEKVRVHLPVGVSYGSDARQVEQVLLEVARQEPDVLSDPAPTVRFLGFGDSSLQFELLVWTQTLIHRKWVLVSKLNYAIFEAFARHGIEIPFPQRVVHLPGPKPPRDDSDN